METISKRYVEPTQNSHYIQHINRLAIEIQNEGIGTVFTTFNGHITGLIVEIHIPAWSAGGDATYVLELSVGKKELVENFHSRYEEVMAKLQKIRDGITLTTDETTPHYLEDKKTRLL